jgi:hypothetical protein
VDEEVGEGVVVVAETVRVLGSRTGGDAEPTLTVDEVEEEDVEEEEEVEEVEEDVPFALLEQKAGLMF